MVKEHKLRFLNILVICGLALFVGFSYYLFILLTGKAIPCPFYEMTGYLCPGCGITRMFEAAFHCDFKSAFYFNPLFFLITPILFGTFIVESVKYIKVGRVKLYFLSKAVVSLCGGAIFIFGFIRNF